MSTLLEALRSLGRADALALRGKAQNMTGTEIIASEHCVPAWDGSRDYSSWPVGSPVSDEGQVWTLIQPHNAANYEGRPSTMRALWGLCHTTDPSRAKPWVEPLGTSGMYMAGECYIDTEGTVWRCLQDNTVYDASALPDVWTEVTV